MFVVEGDVDDFDGIDVTLLVLIWLATNFVCNDDDNDNDDDGDGDDDAIVTALVAATTIVCAIADRR
jgi:hypothetical protein